jgi:Fe-S cluster biosynthesis and repair protein YggX
VLSRGVPDAVPDEGAAAQAGTSWLGVRVEWRARGTESPGERWGVETIACRRCGEGPELSRAPFRSELGERVLAEICQNCWQDWLQHQTLLINHYGLDPREAKAREFLYEQVAKVLLGDGPAEQVDTTKQGSIEW